MRRVAPGERRARGSGPSGRNGEFCSTAWEDLEALVRVFGETTRCVAETAQRSVGEMNLARRERGRRMVQPRRARRSRRRARTGRRVGVLVATANGSAPASGCDCARSGAGAVPVAGVRAGLLQRTTRRCSPPGWRWVQGNAPCARRADPRVRPRDAVPRRPPVDVSDRHRQRAGRARGPRPRRVSASLPAFRDPSCRGACIVVTERARPARGDRLTVAGLADWRSASATSGRRPTGVSPQRRRGDGTQASASVRGCYDPRR
jgi:hypothetical protein